MRVLLFVDNLDYGGAQAQLVQIANALEKDPDFEVWVGCLRCRGPLLRDLAVPPARVREYSPGRFYNVRGARRIARLAWDIVRSRIDLVHAFDFYANVMCAAAVAWNPKARLIVSRRYEALSDRRLHRIGEHWSYRLAHAVVMNSASVARDVIQRYRVPPQKVAIIANGVDLARFERRQHLPGPMAQGGRWRLGVVARLSREKGLDVLLDAVARLVGRGCDVELVVVGEGELRAELEGQASSLGLGDRVAFVGGHADVRAWVETFDVAVLPSRGEGLPNALLEYLAMGCPVVATRVGAVPEILHATAVGVTVTPGDSQELAAAIEALLRDPERRAATSLAARLRAEDFALEKMVGRTCQLYRELLGHARRSSE